MKEGNALDYISYIGYPVTAALMVAWILAAWSGFLLGLPPYAPGDGQQALLLGYTRGELSVIHYWFSVTAVFMTIVQMIMSWKTLHEGFRHLTEPDSKGVID